MDLNKPNYGFTEIMGPLLREYVKQSLVQDLQHYLPKERNIQYSDCIFDWSDTCIEGHRTTYLDGELENFSGIIIYDRDKNVIVNGWMDFVEQGDNLHIYWLFLEGGPQYKIQSKKAAVIPQHVWCLLDDKTQEFWAKFRPPTKPTE